MIDNIEIEYEGPDGNWLVVDDDYAVLSDGDGPSNIQGARFSFELSDEACAQLDKALQPWREHMAEGERVRVEFGAHKGKGLCQYWVQGIGPCGLLAGHDEPHKGLDADGWPKRWSDPTYLGDGPYGA